MKKAISLVLVFSILLLSGNMFAKERRGADIEIYKKTQKIEKKMEGTPWEKLNMAPDIRGELIAVKKDSILLLDRYSGADVTIDIRDIGAITIVKKSKFFQGAGLGLLIGASGGALFGFSGGDDPSDVFLSATAEEKAMLGAVAFGVLGIIVGGLAGVAAGTDKTIQFEGKSDSEIQKILEKLRKKARIKNAQ